MFVVHPHVTVSFLSFKALSHLQRRVVDVQKRTTFASLGKYWSQSRGRFDRFVCRSVRCGNCNLGTTAVQNSLNTRIHSANKQEVMQSVFVQSLTFPSFEKPADGPIGLSPGACVPGQHTPCCLTSPKCSTDMTSSALYLPKKQLVKRKCFLIEIR